MNPRPLTIQDKKTFEKFLRLRRHELSVYAFENIYIWKALFDIQWCAIKESLCVFFQDATGCFLYLPPLGESHDPLVIEEAFRFMDTRNRNRAISRIENAEAHDLSFYRRGRFKIVDKPGEYLCRRADLARLKGERFKSKRACCNYFTKHYDFNYLDFSNTYSEDCLRLYAEWMRQRSLTCSDAVYRGMLGDSLRCFRLLLDNYGKMDIYGKLVEVSGEIKGCTFGFKVNPETYCVLYEFTDLSCKGLAQFIFRELCAELKDYRYINIMDDSGLPNLNAVKRSYRPARIIPSYIIQRKDGNA